jgi:chromate transporter
MRKEKFLVIKGHGSAAGGPALTHDIAGHTEPRPGRALRVTAFCLALWWVPVLAVGAWLGWGGTHFQQGMFFSKAAMVTFGGAYAVLPYVAQQAVDNYGWLSAPQMLDGLGLAETTPGPLIMVLQFVGFVGGWQHPGALPPLASATLGAAITTWTTFVPCFLWIFLGAPYVERLRRNERLTCALSAITAAVVGVVLNLAVWFGMQVLFPKALQPDWFAIAVSVVAFAGLQRWKWDVIPVVCGAALLGMLGKALL